ncbi:hypothetical protein C5167_031136 [Papaver somniferum]|nr:hypothetical protein C5167_031136 [Papaver somniferum]
MISAISWVPKGIAKVIPAEVDPPTKEEIDEILRSGTLNRREDSDNENDGEMDVHGAAKGDACEAAAEKCTLVDAAKGVADEISQALAAAEALGRKQPGSIVLELDMENYDEEDDGIEIFSTAIGDRYYPSNAMDPYLKKDDEDEDDDEEIEDMTIKPSDAVIVCARTDDEVCVLEELEDGELNFYSHHDIILSALPLCTARIDWGINGGDKGNYIAVGTLDLAIEIWDLNLIDEIQPFLALGGVAKKRKKTAKYKKGVSHTDSVLGLDWNKKLKYLASASADKSVKVWDFETEMSRDSKPPY